MKKGTGDFFKMNYPCFANQILFSRFSVINQKVGLMNQAPTNREKGEEDG